MRKGIRALGLVAGIMAGCSTLGGPFRETQVDARLYPYLSDKVYLMPQLELEKHVRADLEKNREWHLEHDMIYKMNATFGSTSLTPVTTDDGTIEFKGPREIYVLSRIQGRTDLSRVMILNSADGRRLFHRELSLYESIDPKGALAMKQEILKEYPDMDFKPWSE